MNRKLVLLLCIMCVGCKTKINNDQFDLQGQFYGKNTQYLLLSYLDKDEKYIVDTLFIKNGKFSVTGNINGATWASIKGKVKSTAVEDPNFTDFFLEPKTLSISLTENAFKEKKIVGSFTQKEYENLEKKTSAITAYIMALMEERNNLTEVSNIQDSLAINRQVDKINKDWEEKQNLIRSLRLKYIKDNTKSDLSAYWLKYYFKSLPLDSVEVSYNALSNNVKNGVFGKNIKNKIEITRNAVGSKIGNKAFNFELKNQNHEKITLNSFKGKYILLDFWASWCKPCREENPNLKRIYETFNPKGLEIIGISGDTNSESWIKAIKDDGINIWHQVRSEHQREFVNAQFNIISYPTCILIDPNGNIVNRYREISVHRLGMDDLEEKLKEIFKD